MALSTAIRQTATRLNRERQHKAEVRADEIVLVRDIEDDYRKVDREGDLAIESHFQRLYALADDEEERTAVVLAFCEWQKREAMEDAIVTGSVAEAVDFLKANNELFLADGCGPTGQAA
jgi:hypothetical protein